MLVEIIENGFINTDQIIRTVPEKIGAASFVKVYFVNSKGLADQVNMKADEFKKIIDALPATEVMRLKK